MKDELGEDQKTLVDCSKKFVDSEKWEVTGRFWGKTDELFFVDASDC